MPKVDVKSLSGASSETVELDDSVFGLEPNVAVMHQVVNAQLAAKRSGTHKTKSRSEVRGGGAKPWKQKGTGRARAGTSSSPIWIGGGVAHGPQPRSYAEKTNKKMKKLAIKSALSDRAANEKVVIVDAWSFAEPSTKEAKKVLTSLGVEGRSLVIADPREPNVARSFRNLPEVQVIEPGQLNTYDILVNDNLIFAKSNTPFLESEA